MKIKPIGDLVLLKRIAEDEKRDGIIIPDSAKETPNEAEVLAVGSGKRDKDGNPIPMEIKVGDRVFVPGYGGTVIKVDGAELLLLSYDTILAIIE